MTSKTKYTLALAFIFLTSSFSCTKESEKVVSSNNKEIKWEKISDGFNNAGSLKKPVLIFFYTEWCIYCKKMETEVFEDPDVTEYMNNNFTSIKINPEKENETIEIMGEKITPAKIMAYTGSNGFPTTLFLDAERKPVTTLPGFIEKKTFLPILKYLKEECYQGKLSLDDYIKNPDLCRAKKG